MQIVGLYEIDVAPVSRPPCRAQEGVAKRGKEVSIMYRITRASAVILAATIAVSAALASYHPPAQAQSSHATVSIVLWHQEQPPERVKRIQQGIDAFNASHPHCPAGPSAHARTNALTVS